MSAQSNVFSALQPEKRKNKAAEPQNKMFASFVNNASTSAWGDDSDDEHAAEPAVEEAVAEEEEEESESESESEEEEEEEESVKPAPPQKAEPPARTLSKKEKKELEMKEFEAALADLGIKAEDAPQPKDEKKEETKPETPAASSSDKKKKKKKGKKPAKTAEPEAATTEVVDIKALVKKKAAEPAAVRIAREEKARAKAKGKKDKSSFNEFSI